jgi:superfamily II DNA or RNA helicase
MGQFVSSQVDEMSLRDLPLKRTYDSGEEGVNPVQDFLEPCLSNSVQYDRLSGYFSSRVLALAAQGLGEFLASNGRMRLAMSSQLNPSDFEKLKKAMESRETYDYLFEDIEMDGDAIATMLERKHFEAMCWLIAQGRLEIRIVVHTDEEESPAGAYVPIFHTKIGVFSDVEGSKVSFSGSVNETVAGWTGNIEEFKVFKSWDDATSDFVEADQKTFDKYWENRAGKSFETIELPEALKRRLVSQSPADMPQLPTRAPKWVKKTEPLKFRDYQLAAIDAWVEADMCGILEMATGTGKTKTAKGCIQRALVKGSSLVVVTAPFEHIAKQWVNELDELEPILASGNNDWRSEVRSARNRKLLSKLDHVVVVAVQNTAASDSFVELLKEVSKSFDQTLLIGDEVHGLGATSFQSAMQDFYQYRLGLSATPRRYFDEEGTNRLLEFFGQTVFSFTTTEALKWRDPVTGARALSDYKYHPVFVELDDDELKDYEELSATIGSLSGNENDLSRQALRESLLFARAAIVKTAASKLPSLRTLLTPLARDLEFCLIYCHDMEQLVQVANLLVDLKIPYGKVTGEESNKNDKAFGGISQRDWILQQFANGTTKVLLAIKCLDEGVDIPAARTGFLLASSGNTKEFIQRRGRLLRPSPNKEFAEIYDFLVRPAFGDNKKSPALKAIFSKELSRLDEISRDAINYDDVKTIVAQLLLKLGR